MTTGDRVIVTEPACVEEICDAFGIDSNSYRIYPGGWFAKESLTPVELGPVELWMLIFGGNCLGVYTTKSQADSVIRAFDDDPRYTVRRLIAYVVMEPRP